MVCRESGIYIWGTLSPYQATLLLQQMERTRKNRAVGSGQPAFYTRRTCRPPLSSPPPCGPSAAPARAARPFRRRGACASADWLPRKNRRARPATPNRRCPGRVSARLEFFRMRRRPLALSFYRACCAYCAYCAFCAAGLCSSRFGASKLAPFLRLRRWAACLATLVYCRGMKKPR